jgi:hypothetical protein
MCHFPTTLSSKHATIAFTTIRFRGVVPGRGSGPLNSSGFRLNPSRLPLSGQPVYGVFRKRIMPGNSSLEPRQDFRDGLHMPFYLAPVADRNVNPVPVPADTHMDVRVDDFCSSFSKVTFSPPPSVAKVVRLRSTPDRFKELIEKAPGPRPSRATRAPFAVSVDQSPRPAFPLAARTVSPILVRASRLSGRRHLIYLCDRMFFVLVPSIVPLGFQTDSQHGTVGKRGKLTEQEEQAGLPCWHKRKVANNASEIVSGAVTKGVLDAR